MQSTCSRRGRRGCRGDSSRLFQPSGETPKKTHHAHVLLERKGIRRYYLAKREARSDLDLLDCFWTLSRNKIMIVWLYVFHRSKRENAAVSSVSESWRLAHNEAAAVQERQTKGTEKITTERSSLLPTLSEAPSLSLTR